MARSPNFGDVKVLKATRLAEEPELTVIKNLTPKNSASFFSNSALNRPVVNQQSSDASTINCISRAPTTFPEGGIILSPGTKGFLTPATSAYFATSAAIS